MDYYLFITRRCNLKCSYCCFGDSIFQREAAKEELLDPLEAATFVLDHAANTPEQDNKAFFYGGEPSLEPGWIARFIEATEASGALRYVLQTNGTRLAHFAPALLKKIQFLEISIDGLEEPHDRLRGAGTHARVLKNIEAIRPWYRGEIAARMTYTPQNPLAESVRFLLRDVGVDHVYWMHEDSETPVEAWVETRERYGRELDLLIDDWIESLRRGAPLSIIPFKAVMTALLDPPERSDFRCGVGTSLLVIDVDGFCYPCDLMITEDRRHNVGHITSSSRQAPLPRNELYERRCARCEELAFCGGRCFNISLNADERFDEFCRRTKMLIRKLRVHEPEVRALIDRGTIALADVQNLTTLTEQIP
jgi:radical SAM protein with 4Fe4S-binding SPASM domain